MNKDRYTRTERIGVNKVEQIVLEQFGWIFREQPIVDNGIDAHIEIASEGRPTGKLIAAQIKTGKSHFSENVNSYTFYIDKTHVDYWLNHSLPVILIGVILEDSRVIWQSITNKNVQSTKRGYKTIIPKKNIFCDGTDTKYDLEQLAGGSDEFQKLKKLMLDRPMINYLADNGNIFVEFEDWVNKSLGRTTIKVFFDDEQQYTWPYWFTGRSTVEFIAHIFPWVEFTIDEDYYERHCLFEEDDYYFQRKLHDEIYPFNSNGEVDSYRVKLELNDLGRCCIHLFDYMDS